MKEFQDKTALVTGGSRGIGRATALRLASKGANVAISYLRNHKAAKMTAAEIEGFGRKALLVQANFNEPSDITALFGEVEKNFGSLDILIHSAALGNLRPLSEATVASWDVTMNVNARAFLLCAKFAKSLMMGKDGIIVGVSSMGSSRYIPSYGVIGISKAALEALVRYLAVEFAPLGIRVNAVSGGPIDTDTLHQFVDFQILKDSCIANTPANRLGVPGDLADVVLFLCSNSSRWIVGQTLVADGGMSLSYGYFKRQNASPKK